MPTPKAGFRTSRLHNSKPTPQSALHDSVLVQAPTLQSWVTLVTMTVPTTAGISDPEPWGGSQHTTYEPSSNEASKVSMLSLQALG
eukprot:CAMPEP_0115369730 /NCGR_PEP_ID=MMETSP0270-20121206/106475_1 /TAXON_ID=71861 /ORGANISM="Scrippsiella trochoidea, Strain CCMP3099" /LENGTH=85 /DNA_ID=CAMNT_0002792549 /DNA_START=321 /DNA_END=575 /DNA_ORIENTATION=-